MSTHHSGRTLNASDAVTVRPDASSTLATVAGSVFVHLFIVLPMAMGLRPPRQLRVANQHGSHFSLHEGYPSGDELSDPSRHTTVTAHQRNIRDMACRDTVLVEVG